MKMKLQLSKEEVNKNRAEHAKRLDEELDAIKHIQYFKDMVNVDLRGKRGLDIKGKDFAVSACVNKLLSYLLPMDVQNLHCIRYNLYGDVGEFEFDISKFSETMVNVILEIIDDYNSDNDHKVVAKIIEKYHTCGYCKLTFDATKSFVCPRCAKTN